MKKIFNVSSVIVILIVLLACHQKRPVTVLKVKTKDTVKTIVKQDTLIFKDPALSALVQQTYKYISIFDTVSPMGNPYDVEKFNLKKDELDSIYSLSGDSVAVTTMEGFEITGALSYMIKYNVQKILRWKNIDQYDLTLLFGNFLTIAKSPDRKLYCFSFDEKTGGTYRSCISLIYYNPGEGESQKSFSIEEGSIFNKDGYNTIDTIHTVKGIKYLMSGRVAGCSSCIGNYIDLVHVEKGEFVSDFSYHANARSNYYEDETDNSTVITYNAKLQRINIDYITSDLEPVCNCGKNGVTEHESGGGYEHDGNEDRITCIYAFNGKTFELKRKSEKPVKLSK